ncbi:helix-turn-helix domain-containing protein [Nocardia sp. NPDC046473]|uniref:TetR/AcrR family transcriptional regulator n=1 Tax=Nocardia sp. NPDC046473 TaxID=3155733 RepID=UPI0033C27666
MSEVRASRRDMYAALTRTAILDAAKELFVARGFDATSVDDIARESQLSKGAVYHHFQDKQQVFAEVYAAAEKAVFDVVAEAVIKPGLGPWEVAELAARTALQAYAADESTRALLRQATSVLGQERARTLNSELALPMIRALLEAVAGLGELRPVDIETAAQMVFRMLAEASMLITLADDPDSASQNVEFVALSMLRGLRVDPSA